METLGKIFGSTEKVKIMRLFLFNPGQCYDIDTVSTRTKVEKREVRKELENLVKIGLVKRKMFSKDAPNPDEPVKLTVNKAKVKKKTSEGWVLNQNFIYLSQLQNLLVNTILMREQDILDRLSDAGKVKLVIVSGVFLQNWDGRVDIMVVGDRLKENTLHNTIRKMESEIGKELHYAALETPDFQYRMSVCDKLVRDVLDYPHRVILDRLGMKLTYN